MLRRLNAWHVCRPQQHVVLWICHLGRAAAVAAEAMNLLPPGVTLVSLLIPRPDK